MPVYQYQGQHYDLPDGLSNEAAIAKIKKHLSQAEAPTTESPVKDFGKQVAGVAEAGAAMVAPLPSTIAGGLMGLGDLLSGKGIERAGKRVGEVQDWNFGLGAYKPYTEKGKQLNEKVSGAIESGLDKVGDVGDFIGGDLGRTNARVSAEVLLNLVPLGLGGVAGRSLAKGRIKPSIENAPKIADLEATIKPPVEPTPLPEAGPVAFDKIAESQLSGWTEPLREPLRNSMEDVTSFAEQQRLKKAQEAVDARQAALEMDVKRQAALDNGAAERARQENAPTGYNDWQVNKAAEEAAATYDYVSQLKQDEIDATPHGDRPAQYGFTDTGGRVDENGIPIRADLSMEAQNLTDPLQRNLWGDELPRKGEQESPFGMTEAIDSLPDLPWKDSPRDAAINSLKPLVNIPRNQRGAIDLGSSPEPGRDHPNSVLKLTPTQIQDSRRQAAAKSVLGNAYVDNITTPEAVLGAVANGAKDVGPIAAARMKSVGSGINSAVLSSNNPLLKFGRQAFRTAEKLAESFSTKYITGKDAAGPQWARLSQKERNEIGDVLLSQDRNQKWYTEEELSNAGFNPRQIAFINHIHEMENTKLKVWNEKRAEVGKNLVKERQGHFPGIFKGDYRTLMVDKDNNPIGFVGTLTKRGNKSVVEQLKKDHPDAKFIDLGRKDLGRTSGKHNTTGLEDLLALLAEHDPKFAEMQDKISAITAGDADKLYGADFHAKGKKGIIGSEGNKPWIDKTENTNAMMKAYFQYWEEGMLSHHNLPVETQLKALMRNPEMEGMPNAISYMKKYMKNMTGRNPEGLAAAFDTIIDAPFKGIGVGPTVPRNIINQGTKRIGQLLMGYGNIAHSAMQMAQVPTMAIPEFRTIAHQFNIPEIEAQGAGASGLRLLGDMAKEKITGEPASLSAYDRTTLDYAEHMGLGHFSEFQDVSKQTQSKAGQTFDKWVDLNRTIPETTTRPYVFFTIAKMLEKHPELSMQEKMSVAYNATQEAMIDYSPRERPMIYSDIGKLGQLTGSLSTFTHGAFGQLGRMGKEFAKGNPTPLLSAAAIMFALGGVKGIWGYDSADAVVKSITESLGNRQSIRELLLDPNISSEVIKSGALSTAVGADLSSRISINIPNPGSITEAIAGPFATDLGKRVGSLYELVKEQDGLAAKNALITNLPNSVKKFAKELLVTDDETGAQISTSGTQAGLYGNPRSPEERALAKWGVTSMGESQLNEAQYNDLRRNMAKNDERQQIVKDAVRAARQYGIKSEIMDGYLKKYLEAQGDPTQWVSSLVQEGLTEAKDKQTRLQGIPGEGLSSIYRYQNFERSRKLNEQRQGK